MALSLLNYKVEFDSTKGKIQHEHGSVTFSSNVIVADAALKGYDIKFSSGDHHLSELEISIQEVSKTGPTVNFTVYFLMRDASGDIDDPFEGWVDILVIADLQ
jgi:hypothetical protein